MRIAVSIVAAALLALAGCKGPGSVEDAKEKVAIFHKQLDAGDFETIWTEAGPDIKSSGKADFLDLLQRVHLQMGNVKDSKQTGWRSEVNTKGNFSQVVMDTTFERGNGEETFVYRNTDDGQVLAGYGIKPVEAPAK